MASVQYSCLENSMDRRAWWATVRGVAKSRTWLSDCIHTHTQEFQSEKINYSSRVLFSLYLTFSYISAYVKMKLEIDIINISIASRKDTDSTGNQCAHCPGSHN